MTNVNHTPGPWKIDSENNRILATDERETIVCGFCGSCRNPEVMADAHLIAAAPDLLTALLLYISSGIGNSTDFEKQREAYSAARAAIAKAKGDQ